MPSGLRGLQRRQRPRLNGMRRPIKQFFRKRTRLSGRTFQKQFIKNKIVTCCLKVPKTVCPAGYGVSRGGNVREPSLKARGTYQFLLCKPKICFWWAIRILYHFTEIKRQWIQQFLRFLTHYFRFYTTCYNVSNLNRFRFV